MKNPQVIARSVTHDQGCHLATSSSAVSSATSLSKQCSFRMSRFGHNCFAVLVKEMEGLLMVLGVMVVVGGEIILISTLRFASCTPLCLRKAHETHRSSASSRAASCCMADRLSKAWVCTSWATHSNSTLCWRVTPTADATLTFVLNRLHHCGLDRVSCRNE